jgi:hypothetical protein
MVWRLDGPGGPVNFRDVQSWEEADFLAPPFTAIPREQERQVRRRYMRLSIQQADEEKMA